MDGIFKNLFRGARLQQVAQMEHTDAVRDVLDHGPVSYTHLDVYKRQR